MKKQKSIQVTEASYREIVDAAMKCGYKVERGRGSQLAHFVEAAAIEKVRREIQKKEKAK
jgi:hypothetical protein